MLVVAGEPSKKFKWLGRKITIFIDLILSCNFQAQTFNLELINYALSKNSMTQLIIRSQVIFHNLNFKI